MSSDDVYFDFAQTGDWMHNSRPLLEKAIDAGVRTIVYDGDVVRTALSGFTDVKPIFIGLHSTGLHPQLCRGRSYGACATSRCGSHADICCLQVDALQTKFTDEYSKQEFTNYTVAGQVTGMYKNAGTFSYVRVYAAGHEVPAYKYGTLEYGQAALQMFSQIMSNESLSST